MINEIKADTESRMKKSLESLQGELAKLRTGRAHPSLLDPITVLYYDQPTPLSQVATIGVEDSRTLTVAPWEKQMIPLIEKAILSSDLGLNPSTSGQVIRVPLPPLTEERRKDLAKLLRQEAENARIAVRNIRRDANQQVKNLLKAKELSEDDERRAQDTIQKITDTYIQKVDNYANEKETDLMQI